MNAGRYTLVLDVPPHLARDLLARRHPVLKLDVEATAMVQAGLGAAYAQQIVAGEIAGYLARGRGTGPGRDPRVADRLQPQRRDRLVHQRHGNPQQRHHAGDHPGRRRHRARARARHPRPSAGDARRPHGDRAGQDLGQRRGHPDGGGPVAGGGRARRAAGALAGSLPAFMAGTAIYLFFATAVGLYLGTVSRSMPQLGLLFLLVYLPLAMLSAATRPSRACRLGCPPRSRPRRQCISWPSPGRPVPRRRPGRRMAAARRHRRHRWPLPHPVASSVPLAAKAETGADEGQCDLQGGRGSTKGPLFSVLHGPGTARGNAPAFPEPPPSRRLAP